MDVVRYRLSRVEAAELSHLDNNTFFASPGFAALWRAVGGRPVVWLARERLRPVAALPAVEFGYGVFTRLQTMPDGTYARLRVAAGIDRSVAAQSIMSAIGEHGYFRVHVTDFDDQFGRPAGYAVAARTTDLVDISSGDWRPPDRKLCGEIAQATRRGISVQPFQSDRHMASFLDLVRRTEYRHGRTPRYPEEFYQALARLAARDQRVRWLWCEHEGRPAASHILFQEGAQLLSWQIYYDKAASFLKPNQHILFVEAQRAAREGVKYLNLGASPPDADSLTAYKSRWGGRAHEYRLLTHRSWLGRLL